MSDSFKVPEVEKEQSETESILENFAKKPIQRDAAPAANSTAAVQGAPAS